MTPSAKKIEQALLDGTFEVYSANPDDTSVNKVRKHAEEKLDLEDGFLSTGTWKSKSKTLIKDRVEKLMEGWVPDSKDESDSNAVAKRPSSEVASPESKRQKRGPKPKKAAEKPANKPAKKPTKKPANKPAKKPAKKPTKKEESSELSDLSDLSELSDEENPEPQKKKPAADRKSKSTVSDDQMMDVSGNEAPEVKAEQNTAQNSARADENEVSAVESTDIEEPSSEVKKPQVELGDAMEDVEPKPAVDEEEEYSDVIDEPPKPKRKQKTMKESSSKPATSSKAASKKAPVSEDPQEAEIKKLQAQLVKCGIRKLWHNELKEYDGDSRAKIRHLKKMLSDVGMDGRFSEAKAREIKEMRELMAEAESAQEMNKLWGMDKGGRVSRSKGKPTKAAESEASGGDDDKEDEDEEDEEDNTYAARRKRAQADLAFLGDDSDSE